MILRGLAVATSLLAAGCAVGPDFDKPAPPPVEGYTPEPLKADMVADETADGPTQTLSKDLDIPGAWWELFHSEALNALVTRALARNQDLAAAQAALVQARENVYAQEGNFFPSVSASFQPSRNKTATGSLSPASASGNPYYSLYTAQLSVSYNPDVFGLNRRQTESLVATSQDQRFQLEATYLTLTSNVVAAAVAEASLRAQIAATLDVIKVEGELLRILRTQMNLGQIAHVDELAQEAALAQAQATLPPLQKQLAQQRDLITALAGGLPSEDTKETFTLASLRLPDALPISVPSKLVEQRPDIRQAEENMHAASALIGVAVANRLPLVSLTAFGGSEANYFNSLFTPGNQFWTLLGSVTQPLFDGGILLHRERFARAAFDQAAAQYRSTVITAFQNVADALRALQADADSVRASAAAERAAAATLAITRVQLSLGQVAYLSLLNAEQTELQARLTLVQAQANRLADTAGLLQALGGGWWNRQDVQVKDIGGDDVLAILGIH
jgi:NodT family efflux transporter outer membrane factor (OMF) lipoprotein